MAIKKSDLYSSLWASCDALRGGMDASQYKDYVLVLLFIKYVSDKYAGVPFAPIAVPRGASFAGMAALKGKPDIGDRVNKQIIAPLFNANRLPLAYAPDFNEAAKLGSGRELVDRLSDLIAIFQNPALDFSKNRAGDDDLMGDAYEYLMRHFATESGKSKGQFYTPSEVSRVIAAVIGIGDAETTNQTTVYDPTCGSGSLLLKVADTARARVSLFGQEKDSSTAGLARMNMILHDNAAAEIEQGNTLANPKYLDGSRLRAFDYVIANPPFSDKRWTTGLDPEHDPYERFDGIGIPPGKQGDYAYLLHILKSMKSTAAGACVLPHGVLFRGNAEGEIRQNLIRRGVIKGIIGLPANLFYGTGIPACIVVLDKREANARRGVFMLDASAGFLKDGPKNRLRARDIHRIVATFQALRDVPHYARMVPLAEIEKNGWNLNLPRYLDTRPPEDQQDIEAHLAGGIPAADVDALADYWQVCPTLRDALFSPLPSGEGGAQRQVRVRYFNLISAITDIKPAIQQHPEFQRFIDASRAHWTVWQTRTAPRLKALKPGFHPRDLIHDLSADLLAHYRGQPLIDAYAVYQHLMDYWDETLRDDAYLIAADGWQAKPQRIIETDKKGREKDKGWACDLVPKALIVARFFAAEQAKLDALTGELETAEAALSELEEENSGEDAAFSGFDKINAKAVKERLDEIAASSSSPRKSGSTSPASFPRRRDCVGRMPERTSSQPTTRRASAMDGASKSSDFDDDNADEIAVLHKWQKLDKQRASLKKRIKDADAALDTAAYAKYADLTALDIKTLVVDDKWLAELARRIGNETERAGQQLTRRVKELAERYAAPLPQLEARVAELQVKVDAHLKAVGSGWNADTAQALLTGRQRLPGFSGEWSVKRLGELATFHKGKGLPKSAIVVGGTLPCVHYGELFTQLPETIHTTRSRTNWVGDSFRSVANDVLMPTSDVTPRGLAKASCIEVSDVIVGGDILVIRADPGVLSGTFLSYVIRNSVAEVLQLVTGTTVFHLYASDMRKFEIALPSIGEQRAIIAVLDDVDAAIDALEARIAKTRALKAGMMQQLLTGRIRLVPQGRAHA